MHEARHESLVIAHRGVHSRSTRENTLAAFQAALEAGADMIELDARRSADGHIVVLHDASVAGVALEACALDEFAARSGFRPPLLGDVLAWANGKIGIDLELKERGYVAELTDMLIGLSHASVDAVVTSFIADLLAEVHAYLPTVTLGLLVEDQGAMADAVAKAHACGAKVLLPEVALLNDRTVADAVSSGLSVITWGFFAREHAAWMRDGRLRGVITDDVPGALELRAMLGNIGESGDAKAS